MHPAGTSHVPRLRSWRNRGGMREDPTDLLRPLPGPVRCRGSRRVARGAWHGRPAERIPGASASALGRRHSIRNLPARAEARTTQAPTGSGCSTWNTNQGGVALPDTTGGHSHGRARFLYAVLLHRDTVGTYLPPWAAACVALIGARSLLPVPRGTSRRRRDPSAPPRPGRVSRKLHDGGPAMSSRSAIPPVSSERAAQSVAKSRSASSGPPLASEYARSESQGCTRTRTSPARLLPGSAFCRGRVGHHGPEPAWNQRSRLDRLSRRRRTA